MASTPGSSAVAAPPRRPAAPAAARTPPPPPRRGGGGARRPGLDGIGQKAPDRILVLDLSGHLSPAVLAEWPATVVPLRRGMSPAAAHNQLADIAFAEGSDIHVVLSAQGVLAEGALPALITTVRAAGRQAIVGAVFPPQDDETAAPVDPPWLASPAIAVPKAIWHATRGFDMDFAGEGADIDFSWRVQAAGFALMECPGAVFEAVPRSESRATARLGGAFVLARKWHLRELESAASQQISALGLSTPTIRQPPGDRSPPQTPPSLEALLPPW